MLIEALVCQHDGGDLIANENLGEYIKDCNLTCVVCGRVYRISDGIFRVVDVLSLDSVEMQSEILIRDEQADSYDKRLAPRFYKEVKPTLQILGNCEGKKIIEYGCGTGRITREIKGAYILATDFSLVSLGICKENIDQSVVGLVLADSSSFKSKDNFFDLAVSFQFLEHLLSKEIRKHFYLLSRETLKRGGRFIVTAYHNDLRRWWRREAQEGYHLGGVFYHYFSPKELCQEIGDTLTEIKIKFLDLTLPGEKRMGIGGPLGGLISVLFSKIFILQKLAHLVAVTGTKQ